MRRLLLILVFCSLEMTIMLCAQNSKYWVFLKNKKNVTFDPYSYFDKKAIDRRIENCIPLVDSTDFPLNGDYTTKVISLVDSVSNSSRWFNAMSIYATSSQVGEVLDLPFVSDVEEMATTVYAAAYASPAWDTTMNATLTETLENKQAAWAENILRKPVLMARVFALPYSTGVFQQWIPVLFLSKFRKRWPHHQNMGFCKEQGIRV